VTGAGSDNSEAPRRNAELLQLVESQWPEWEREGIGPDEESILDAAAVGLVEGSGATLRWRTCTQAAARGAAGRPTVALQRVAKAALPREYGLLEFEDHVLDRHRPWAAGGRTLQEMGYGHLGVPACGGSGDLGVCRDRSSARCENWAG
jgi:hypothetical protein